jgi:hypothetical protein
MLKIKIHSGFHDLFLNWPTWTGLCKYQCQINQDKNHDRQDFKLLHLKYIKQMMCFDEISLMWKFIQVVGFLFIFLVILIFISPLRFVYQILYVIYQLHSALSIKSPIITPAPSFVCSNLPVINHTPSSLSKIRKVDLALQPLSNHWG